MFGYHWDSAQIKAEQPGSVASHPKQIKPEDDPSSVVDVLEFEDCARGEGAGEAVYSYIFSLLTSLASLLR